MKCMGEHTRGYLAENILAIKIPITPIHVTYAPVSVNCW